MPRGVEQKATRTGGLARALGRISDRVSADPTEATVLLAVTEEAGSHHAQARRIKFFGKLLFEAIRKRPRGTEPLRDAIEDAVREVLGTRASDVANERKRLVAAVVLPAFSKD